MSTQNDAKRVPMTLHRRRFLRGSAALAAGGGTLALPTRGLAAGVAPEHLDGWLTLFQQSTPVSLADYQPVALTADELATLVAAIDRIIPSDELGPGASETGVHIYIDRSLKGP